MRCSSARTDCSRTLKDRNAGGKTVTWEKPSKEPKGGMVQGQCLEPDIRKWGGENRRVLEVKSLKEFLEDFLTTSLEYFTIQSNHDDVYRNHKNSLQYGFKSIRYMGAKR